MVKLKVMVNKRTKQLMVAIPRKKFLELKKKDPQFIKVKKIKFE